MSATRKSEIMRTVPLLIAVCLFGIPAQAKYGGGTGEPNDPYQIATAEDLIALGETPDDYDKHFILTADIDLAGHVFDKAVIAPDTNDPMWYLNGPWFIGIFDGNEHTISNLTITGKDYVGLFGYLGSKAKVKNLGVVNVNIAGSGDYVGGTVGYNGGNITMSYSAGTVTGSSNVGGLMGRNSGTVTGCYSTGPVSGLGYVGGLMGRNDGRVTQCYSTGVVIGRKCVGGLAGFNTEFVTNCYSTAVVSGNEPYIGGLLGISFAGFVIQCYSTGAVTGPQGGVGGLVGDKVQTFVIQSFWDTQTSGQATSAGGTGKTTVEMQMANTYLEAGWDFVNVWGIGENQTYPYLRRYSAADANQDGSVNFLDLAVFAENWLTGMAP